MPWLQTTARNLQEQHGPSLEQTGVFGTRYSEFKIPSRNHLLRLLGRLGPHLLASSILVPLHQPYGSSGLLSVPL